MKVLDKARGFLSGNEKAFPCPECGRKFGSQNALNSHVGHAHPGEKVFDCPYCDKSFVSRGVLSQHLQIKHEDKLEHECPNCGKKFRNLAGLRIHISKKHSRIYMNALDYEQGRKKYEELSGQAQALVKKKETEKG